MKRRALPLSKIFSFVKRYIKDCDKFLWLITILCSVYSLLLLGSVSRGGENFFNTQLIAVIIGYIGAIVLSAADYRVIAGFWKWIALFSVLIIVYTLIFGITIEGSAGVNAKAWITLPGGITFQPSELVKICFIITFSKHLSIVKENGNIKSFKSIMLLCVHAVIPVILTHLQGDDGAAIIFFFMFLSMTFAAGVQLRYFIALLVTMVIAIPFAWNYLLADYQKNRIINQFNPESDPLGDGFQQIQGKISIGSGQIYGKGLFNGRRVLQGSVPVQESDFIFSVAGEELGFIGCILVILLILLLLIRAIYIGAKSCDLLGSYISIGFFGMIASQAIFNLGMCLSLLPVMGVTLPFFSAGGSSSACLYFAIGLLQSVYIKRLDTDKAGLSSI